MRVAVSFEVARDRMIKADMPGYMVEEHYVNGLDEEIWDQDVVGQQCYKSDEYDGYYSVSEMEWFIPEICTDEVADG